MRETLSFYPDIGLVANQVDMTSETRLWLLMKAEARSGHILVSDVYAKFSGKNSPYYIFGKRRMTTVLKNGDGIFWQYVRNGKMLRIKGKDAVAKNLGIEDLEFKVVKLQTKYLLAGLKETRAAFLDAAHVNFDNPVSRQKLQEKTGISVSSQKTLEKSIDVKHTRNIVVVDETQDEQDRLWKDGFTFKMYDRTGKVTGEKGAFFLAKQIPNTYHNNQCKAGQRGRLNYNHENGSRQKLTNKTVQNDSRERLYSTPQSTSSKARYKKAFNMLTGSSTNRTKLENVGVFYNMKW